jgi:hypothetical protein
LTFAQLVAIAEQKSRHDWNQTSLLAAIAVNTSMAKGKGRKITPADFNPWTKIDEDTGRRVRFTPQYLDKLIAESEAARAARDGGRGTGDGGKEAAPPVAAGGWETDETKQPT